MRSGVFSAMARAAAAAGLIIYVQLCNVRIDLHLVFASTFCIWISLCVSTPVKVLFFSSLNKHHFLANAVFCRLIP